MRKNGEQIDYSGINAIYNYYINMEGFDIQNVNDYDKLWMGFIEDYEPLDISK